jgi:hypothetical protein
MMKKTVMNVTVLVCAAALALAACSNGTTDVPASAPQTAAYSGMEGTTLYTLEITENTGRAIYAPQSGDRYVLTIHYDPVKTSSGAVSSFSGGTFTLKPSNSSTTFTAAVSAAGITAMTGTIALDDTSTTSAPASITAPAAGVPADLQGTWDRDGDEDQYGTFSANSLVWFDDGGSCTISNIAAFTVTNTKTGTKDTYPNGYLIIGVVTTKTPGFPSDPDIVVGRTVGREFFLNGAKDKTCESGNTGQINTKRQ